MSEKQIKALVVFGTRPEAIKMCPLVNELKTRKKIDTKVCVTGQHREMLKQVLKVFNVVPDYDLDIMKDKQTLSDVTSDVLLGMRGVLEEFNPDIVFVHGDTNTAFSASLAAFYKQIDVAHVEAGLRTKNIYSPYPEEYYRQAISIVAKYNFAPTQLARYNLRMEGKDFNDIFVTGNTGIDAFKSTVRDDYKHEILDWAEGSRLIVMTAHRRENLGEPMRKIFKAVRRVIEAYEDVKVVYPVHLNPIITQLADEELAGIDRVRLIPPLDVVDFHNLMKRSYFILTDSGGIQEEAPFFGKPVLVMRDTTERPEGIDAGTLKLVGTDPQIIFFGCRSLFENPEEYEKMSSAKNPYGDGAASIRICDIIESKMLK